MQNTIEMRKRSTIRAHSLVVNEKICERDKICLLYHKIGQQKESIIKIVNYFKIPRTIYQKVSIVNHSMQTYLPAEEIVQIVDRENQVVDAVPRKIMRVKGLIHRASYILVFHPDGRLFVQKRTMTKDVFPGYWDVAAGGVVLAGEDYLESARRELAEELGVRGVPLDFLFDHFHEDAENKVWGHVFRCVHPGPFTLQKEEIDSGEFMTVERVFELNENEPVTPDGLDILVKLSNFDTP